MSINNKSQPLCRTCFDATDNTFYSLTGKLVKDNQRKTLAGFLWDIANMDNTSEITKQLPQQLCGNCLRKLKVSFSFVTQVQKVNRDMLNALRSKNSKCSSLEDIQSTEYEAMNIEDNNLQDNTDEKNNIQECFIDCNNPLAQDYDDPIAISRIKSSNTGCKRGECIHENFEDSTLCKNECHTEMKSMLHKLMSLQYQLNARIKSDSGVTKLKSFNQPKKLALNPNEKTAIKINRSLEKTAKVGEMSSIKFWFPISSVDQAIEVEQKIKNGSSDDVVSYLKGLVNFKGANVDDVLRFIFDDDLAEQFNLEGRKGKMSLISYDSILNCVRSVFSNLTTDDFYKLIRRYILLCHNRNKQKKHKKKNRDLTTEQDESDDEETVSSDYTMKIEIDETANNKSEEIFCEALSEDTMLFDHQLNYDIKPDVYSNSDKACLEEVVVDVPETNFNDVVDDMPSCTVDKLPKKSQNQINTRNSAKGENQESKRKKLTKISSLFPIPTHDDISEIEKNLSDPDYAEKISEHIKRMKIHKGDVDKVLRCIFTDKVIADYNYDGRSGKRSLQSLNLVSTHLYNAFSEVTRMEFSKLLRRYVFMSHNRHKHKMYVARKYDVFA